MARPRARSLLTRSGPGCGPASGSDIVDVAEQHGHAVATGHPRRYHDVCRFLRDEPDFACDYCDFTGAVDFGPDAGFEVVTHLFSTTHHHNVRVKVRVPYEDAGAAHDLRPVGHLRLARARDRWRCSGSGSRATRSR